MVDVHLDEGGQGPVSARALEEAERQLARAFDRKNGGFGTQPKFPHPGAMTLLLHRWWDHGSDEVRTILDRTLQGMGRGGVYDQVGGGFHRYSVDAEWIVPHFEKMSYDNSELLRAYLDAYSLFGTEEYADVARGIVRWVREVASDPEAGYAASQDADVGLHDDGDYFTWTWDEAAAVLGEDELEIAAAYYDIGTAGEMHHNPSKNVLYVATTVAELARRTERTEHAVRSLLASAREKLKAARDQRPAPFVDRTRYTAWNAMMTSALLQGGAVLDDDWANSHALSTLALAPAGGRGGRGRTYAGRRRRALGRSGADRRGRARRLSGDGRSRVAWLGRGDHGPGLAGLLGRRARGIVRHRQGTRGRDRRGAGARQAGAGHADAISQRSRRHRGGAAARAHR